MDGQTTDKRNLAAAGVYFLMAAFCALGTYDYGTASAPTLYMGRTEFDVGESRLFAGVCALAGAWAGSGVIAELRLGGSALKILHKRLGQALQIAAIAILFHAWIR